MSPLRLLASSFILIVLLAGTAWAETSHVGYYVGVYGGSSFLNDISVEDDLGDFDLETDAGIFFAGTLGYDLALSNKRGNGRFELEYSYRSNDFSKIKASGGSTSASGELVVQSLMISSYAVINTGKTIKPYFGIGGGAALVEVNDLKVSGAKLSNDDDLVPAFQAGLGLEMELSENVRLDLGYRYFYAHNAKIKEVSGNKAKFDYNAHTALAGLVFMF